VAQVKLGRDQVLKLDGVVLEGVRELDVDMDMSTHDVTSWWHGWKSTLPIAQDATIKVLIYWAENYADFNGKFNVHPPQPMTLEISNVGSGDFVPVKVSVKQPLQGVLAWEVTLKLWTYGPP
jgi:hypothetical protein